MIAAARLLARAVLHRPLIAAFRAGSNNRNGSLLHAHAEPKLLDNIRNLSVQSKDKTGTEYHTGSLQEGHTSQPQFDDASNPRISVDFDIPLNKARAVVGQRGSTVQSIEKESGTTIFVERARPASSSGTVKVQISGPKNGVSSARQRIDSILQSEDTIDHASTPNRAGPHREKMHQEEIFVGPLDASYIIGKGGATLRSLQDETASAHKPTHSPRFDAHKRLPIDVLPDKIESSDMKSSPASTGLT